MLYRDDSVRIKIQCHVQWRRNASDDGWMRKYSEWRLSLDDCMIQEQAGVRSVGDNDSNRFSSVISTEEWKKLVLLFLLMWRDVRCVCVSVCVCASLCSCGHPLSVSDFDGWTHKKRERKNAFFSCSAPILSPWADTPPYVVRTGYHKIRNFKMPPRAKIQV